jgi:hypothetical protein
MHLKTWTARALPAVAALVLLLAPMTSASAQRGMHGGGGVHAAPLRGGVGHAGMAFRAGGPGLRPGGGFAFQRRGFGGFHPHIRRGFGVVPGIYPWSDPLWGYGVYALPYPYPYTYYYDYRPLCGFDLVRVKPKGKKARFRRVWRCH